MPEQEHEQLVRELAAAYDVATDYWDWQGRHVAVATDTLVAVLRALDVDARTAEAARVALAAEADAPWGRMLPPALVTREGRQPTFEVHVPEGWAVDVWVELETGEHRGGVEQRENWNPPRTVGHELVGEATFAVPGDLPLGYHELRADGGASVNGWLMRFQADVLGAPVVVPEVEQTTALGAACLAGVGAGLWSQDRVVSSWRARSRYEPTMRADEREELLAGWHAAVHTARNHGHAER